MEIMETNCTCDSCQSACARKPGWFLPGEAEEAAKLKGMSLSDFFRAYLGVDWWEGEDPIFVLAPATTSMDPGTTYSARPTGRCVFFNETGRCDIYTARPAECRMDIHNHHPGRHEAVAMEWRGHHEQVRDLLGEEPEAEEYSFLEAFSWL